MLGGDKSFKKVMERATGLGIKVVVDCMARVSSSRSHRKYRTLMTHSLDTNGKLNIQYGGDGQGVNYEDTAVLNYRKLENWELLISEVLDFSKKYNTDGVHLDNGQAWP